jgi:hypothetical protein
MCCRLLLLCHGSDLRADLRLTAGAARPAQVNTVRGANLLRGVGRSDGGQIVRWLVGHRLAGGCDALSISVGWS